LSAKLKHEVIRAVAWLFLAVIIVVASLVAARVQAQDTARNVGRDAAHAGTRAAQEVVSTQLAKGCGRTQVQRGYLLLRSGEVKSETARQARHLFRIVWCEQTYAVDYNGPAIYLPDDDERCFLSLLQGGYWNEREPHTDPRRLHRACATT
jgi:hypothetical protein